MTTFARRGKSVIAIQLFVMLLAAAQDVCGQYNSFNQRDDKYRLLGLKRAKEYYEITKKDFERQKALFEKGLISQVEYDRVRNAMADAEVNYQQSLLAVIFEQQYVTVDHAVKYQDADGRKRVRLTVANTSTGTEEYQKLIGIEDKLFRSLQPDVIQNVYVSLYNGDGVIISQPYEVKIGSLSAGKPREINFGLLQDVDFVTVNIIYGNGSSRALKIYLQKDNAADAVAVQSQQFSQEAELGKTATYDLTLELFSGSKNTFGLEVVNLPKQVDRYFKDVSTSARLTQIKFTESSNSKKAALDVTLPDRPTEAVAMDTPIQFYVVVVAADRMEEFSRARGSIRTEEDLKKLKFGFVKLELLPRGKGRILVKAPQLYYTIKPDGALEIPVDLVNEGTRRLDNVKIDADVPLNWTESSNPPVLPSLEINEDRRFVLKVVPPQGTPAGRYEVRLRTSGLSDNQPVNAEDKTVIVEIMAETSIWGTLALVTVLLGLITGIVVFGIRLSKR